MALQTEFVGDLPAHLSCWSNHVGRSDVIVAKVAAPASDPSLRKLPRSIQFQGLRVSISVSRSLQNKHEQRKAKEADTSSQQARRHATRVKRQASKRQSQQRKQQQQPPPAPQHPHVEHADPTLPDEEPLLQAFFPIGGGSPIIMGSKEQTAQGVGASQSCLLQQAAQGFFFFFCFGREGDSFDRCNDNNLKSM